MVEDKVVLYGEMSSMKKILEGDQKPTFRSGLSAAIKQTGLKSTVTVVVDLESLPERERKSMERDLGRDLPGFADAFPGMKVLTLQFNATDKLKATAAVTCKDADTAAATLKVGEAGLAKIKGLTKNPNADKLPPEVQEAAQRFRQNARRRQVFQQGSPGSR